MSSFDVAYKAFMASGIVSSTARSKWPSAAAPSCSIA